MYFINVILFRAKSHIYLINFTSSSVQTTTPKSLALQSKFDFTGIVSFHLQIFSLSLIFYRISIHDPHYHLSHIAL